jgi:tetratricopeptide (TPR) repeat protein
LAASSGAAPAAGQEDFLRGLDALQNQQWRDAAQAFSAAVQADDENAEYHTALAIASMLSQDLQTAKTEFDRALRLNPNDVTAQRWAAGYYRMIGNANAAARIRPPSDYPGTVQEAAENAGRAQRASPQQQQAAWAKLCAFGVAYARDVKQSHPALAGASFDRAKQEFDQRNIDQAIADLQIVLNANPDDANALYWYARCSLAKGQLYGAREQLTRVLTVATNFGPAYAVRSVVEARLGSVDRAKADFDLAKKLGGEEGLRRGGSRRDGGCGAGAEQAIRRACRNVANDRRHRCAGAHCPVASSRRKQSPSPVG